MVRKLFVCTVVVAVFAAVLFGVQADTQAEPQDVVDNAMKFVQDLLKGILQRVEDAVRSAQDFVNGVKQKIREEEDKLLNEIPDPLGRLLKDIVNRIRQAEEQKAELRANMTECVTSEAKPAFDIVSNTMQEVRSCVQQKTKDIQSTISDLEDLIRQGLGLVTSAPRELMPCIKFPPTSETWTCISGKMRDLSSKALTIASSLIGDVGTIGQEVPEVIRSMINCGVEAPYEAEKKLGQIIEKIGACESDVVSKST